MLRGCIGSVAVMAALAPWIAGAIAAWTIAMVLAVAVCRAAALGDAHQAILAHRPQDGADVVARALATLEVDRAILIAGGRGTGFVVAADAWRRRPTPDALAAHMGAAAAALRSESTVERPWQAIPGQVVGGRIAAAPVGPAGGHLGALVVSSHSSRPRLTFAERRALRTLAGDAERALRTRPALSRERT
jgi:hypothetical protein